MIPASLRERVSKPYHWLVDRMPPLEFWLGSAHALRIAGWILIVAGAFWFTSGPFTLYRALGVLFAAVALLVIAVLLRLAGALIATTPAPLRWGLALFITSSMAILGGSDWVRWISVGFIGTGAALLGGGLALARESGWRWLNAGSSVLGAVMLLCWLIAYLLPSWPTQEEIHWRAITSPQLQLVNPGEQGPYSFYLRHYGTGNDPQRREFSADVDFVTEPVDGSKLVDGWEGRGGWGRTEYWGIEAKDLPVQGRTWIPEGPGPFPIVLIVHGNHGMEDFSDVGYAYLGELFASRGVIAVSVDENFLNSSPANILGAPDIGLDEENDARGWLLLKHLEQWRAWHENPDHPLFGKIDLERVVLIGHSRGGEAVSEAAVFNSLPAYPDDATLRFDFNFGLRGIIAIAPVDAQYHPRNRPTVVRDTNYLVIHGSHDGDVTSYAGYATYSRASFNDCTSCFKAGFYLLGANHGQFNTSWGRRDSPMPFANALNLRHIMGAEDQRAVASTLFSAFLEVVLFGKEEYRYWLAAPDRNAQLFPGGTRFLSQFTGASERVLVDYSEDDDVSTGTAEGVVIEGRNLALWREAELELKWRSAGTTAAILGWDTREEKDTEASAKINDSEHASNVPRYVLTFPNLHGDADSTISLSLAPSNATPGDAENYEAPSETDFSLLLEDANGNVASLLLSARLSLVARIEPVVFKLHSVQSDRSEIVFQRYRFELREFAAVNPALDLTNRHSFSLVFDQTEASSIVIEQVTWSAEGF
ncbi:MAG: hypothetical protein AAGC91_09770 [Pseudomonadota bacterium]